MRWGKAAADAPEVGRQGLPAARRSLGVGGMVAGTTPRERTAVFGLGYPEFRDRLRRSKAIPGMAREDQAKEPPPPTQYYQCILPRILPMGNDSGARKQMVLLRSETEGRLTRTKNRQNNALDEARPPLQPRGPQAAKPQSASALIAATDDYAYSFS
jgi:hypothetical protein